MIQALVDEWLRLDKNPRTRDEIKNLAVQHNDMELQLRLGSRIEFGTAGLRGRMEAGFSRMNDLTVIQASQGLCEYVLAQIPNAKDMGIVIGYDHRYNSERWAALTAAAFISRGVKAYLFRGIVHTPLVPFSVGQLGAACGVMITASHNPKDDNGYKVYWENAVQIIAPHDEGIAAAIKANQEPGPDAWDADEARSSPLCIDRTEEMIEAYFQALKALSRTSSINGSSPLVFVNTSMHGVGHRFAKKAFEIFGFEPYLPVESQSSPDPEFPTVKFPNPEEKGALDQAIALANAQNATHVLAQDPDADRFAAAEKQLDGTWKIFSGDQLGSVLAAWTLDNYKRQGKPVAQLAMVASAVSSKMIGSMAEKDGFKFVESLTGFKYIGNTGLALEKTGYSVPFGYEEAIGFMLGEKIRDKDGVAATVTFAEMATYLRQEGKTVVQYLEQLYSRYGYFQTSNSYFICRDPRTIDRIFARIRNWPKSDRAISSASSSYPSSLAGQPITSVRDLTTGYGHDSLNGPSFVPELPLSSGHMITFRAGGGNKGGLNLTIRTSGTEPKIKYYLEGSGNDREEVSRLLKAVVEVLRDDWMQVKENGLAEP